MKFILKNLKENITTLTRKIGYRYLRKDEKKGEHVLVRPLELGGYPRFHLFLKINTKAREFSFSLHLDRKKPVYGGVPAHSGEYEGEVVKTEAERIKQALES
jgi:hypothetical protein